MLVLKIAAGVFLGVVALAAFAFALWLVGMIAGTLVMLIASVPHGAVDLSSIGGFICLAVVGGMILAHFDPVARKPIARKPLDPDSDQ